MMRPAPSARSPLGALLVAACLGAAAQALSPDAGARPEPAPSAASASSPGSSPAAPSPAPPPPPSALWALPPGASFPDRGPSPVIFPPQSMPLRFSHRVHVQRGGAALSCETCHPGALRSERGDDRLLPTPDVCDGCHGSSHADMNAVKGGDGPFGSCALCHQGYQAGDGNLVKRVSLPRPRLRSNHKAHADRRIGCESCHGAVQETELATRDQLPRMKGCMSCHGMTGAQAGGAKGECTSCHEGSPDGRMRSEFPDGKLLPPRWLSNMEHTPDFLERHRRVAGENSRACASCHTESFCTDCHDGRVRPRTVHPNDYLSMHAVDARFDAPSCASCHQEQAFCLPCHQRSGVAMTASPGAKKSQARFHPPRQVWSELPRTRQHHAWEAERNLQACVSCHTERDCAVCHASTRSGGRGFNPHPPGFAARCQAAVRRNPRPCMICHEGEDPRSLCR